MAGLYDEKIVGLKEQRDLARRLREQASAPAEMGQMVSGWYVPNYGNAITNALRNIVGGYQERQAEDKIAEAEREKARANIDILGKAGISVPESYLKEAETPAYKPNILAKYLLGEEEKAAQPYKQNVVTDATAEQKRNALLEYQLANGGDISKLTGIGNTFKPTYFTGKNGIVYAVDAANPLTASPVKVSGGNDQLTNAVYDPNTIGLASAAREGAKLHEVQTPSGASTWMTGREIIGGNDDQSLHIGDIVNGKTYTGGSPNDPSSWR